MTIYNKHIDHIQAVNNSKTVEEHAAKDLYLSAWIDGVREAGGSISLISGDMFYLDQGIDRPMCGGVWLDWKPE